MRGAGWRFVQVQCQNWFGVVEDFVTLHQTEIRFQTLYQFSRLPHACIMCVHALAPLYAPPTSNLLLEMNKTDTVSYAMRGEETGRPRNRHGKSSMAKSRNTSVGMTDHQKRKNAVVVMLMGCQNTAYQSFARFDDCHIPPAEMDSRSALGSCFLPRRPSSVAPSRLSSKAPLFFTWRLAAAATAGEC